MTDLTDIKIRLPTRVGLSSRGKRLALIPNKCTAVFAVSHLSVAKATSCLNTSYCERRLAFKNGGGAQKSPSHRRSADWGLHTRV